MDAPPSSNHPESHGGRIISLSWILSEPSSRAKRFVEDGLGAIKLQLAHRERELQSLVDPKERAIAEQMISIHKSWLDAQRMEQLVAVNLGSWSGMSARRMAEETGDLDFYNYVYQPFSSCVHSDWSHISMFNAAYCENPAHGWHRSPALIDIDPDAFWLHLAAKYFSKTLDQFDRATGLRNLPDEAFRIMSSVEADGANSSPDDSR